MSVSGVEGEAKIPLNLGRGSTSNGIKRGSRMPKLNGKKETTLKKEDKRQDYSESECSGVYHQDEMSATRAKSISQDSGDFQPTPKVNISLYELFCAPKKLHVGMFNKNENTSTSIKQTTLLGISIKLLWCLFTQAFSEPNRAKNLIGLKDLCPDDKRRIANLVEELAR